MKETIPNNDDVEKIRTDRSIVTELSHVEAREFFLKTESYCKIGLPDYFVFDEVLTGASSFLENKALKSFWKSKPRNFEDVNYTILNNKDGKYSWRPFQLIHPALYVSLTHRITDEDYWPLIVKRFAKFYKNEKIRCVSMPVSSHTQKSDKAMLVSDWSQDVTQKSLELSLDFEYLIETDIADCYGSTYTHTIAWALHGKSIAKKKRQEPDLIGNIIDAHIQDMSHGQTNCIPQGSVLMDFLAEMVLGYADLLLSQKLSENLIEDYHILRYRDDYRIFVNNPRDGEKIVKALTEIMIYLGMRLNPLKTKESDDVIFSAIKGDKWGWLVRKQIDSDIQKHLLIIHQHGIQFPNSGSLDVALIDYLKRVEVWKKKIYGVLPLIGIVVDIAYRNPRTYLMCCAILSKLLSLLENDAERYAIIEKIKRKFSHIPNTGYMEICLQRITLPFDKSVCFDEQLCKLVTGEDVSIWNSDWISPKELKGAIKASKIIDYNKIQNLAPVVKSHEIELFVSRNSNSYS